MWCKALLAKDLGTLLAIVRPKKIKILLGLPGKRGEWLPR